MQAQMELVLQRIKECIAKADELYGVKLNPQIRFDLKGRAAGMAGMRGFQLFLRFNRDMMGREAFTHVLNNTVPHEVAHLVCFVNPNLGKGHDAGWERVCIALGGTGVTRHSEEVVYGTGKTYEYVTTAGHKVRLSERKHTAVQTGVSLRYRNNLGSITKTCTYSIVGIRGRSLAAPIMQQAANQSAAIEAVVHAAPIQPLQRVAAPARTATLQPGSKAAQARQIMSAAKLAGTDYETIIGQLMSSIGYDRALARATFKANAARVGITL